MGTAKAAAVRTVIAMPVNAAEPCLNTADVVVDQGAFRIAPRAHGVVFIQHETLWSVVEAKPGSWHFHVGGFPGHQHILQMMCLHVRVGGPGQNWDIRIAKSPGRVGKQLDLVTGIETGPLHWVAVFVS
jgi:hypothetical protein